jgi:hypothetical protein
VSRATLRARAAGAADRLHSLPKRSRLDRRFAKARSLIPSGLLTVAEAPSDRTPGQHAQVGKRASNPLSVPEPNEHDEPHVPYADYSAVLAALTNAELLSVLELGLL